MSCPSQKPAHAEAKRAGADSRRKRNDRSVHGATHPKICIRISRDPRPNPECFPDEKNGETRLKHAYKNGWIGKDFNLEITPEPGYPGF